jgi:hypothetical protein
MPIATSRTTPIKEQRIPSLRNYGLMNILVCLVDILDPRSNIDFESTSSIPLQRSWDFWTSDTVHDHTVFGYTYPELPSLSNNTTRICRVNALYGENTTSQYPWDLGLAANNSPYSWTSNQVRNTTFIPFPRALTHPKYQNGRRPSLRDNLLKHQYPLRVTILEAMSMVPAGQYHQARRLVYGFEPIGQAALVDMFI